jgi:hypothetical protein
MVWVDEIRLSDVVSIIVTGAGLPRVIDCEMVDSGRKTEWMSIPVAIMIADTTKRTRDTMNRTMLPSPKTPVYPTVSLPNPERITQCRSTWLN